MTNRTILAAPFLAAVLAASACNMPATYGGVPQPEQEIATQVDAVLGSEAEVSGRTLVFQFASTSRLRPDHEQRERDASVLLYMAEHDPEALIAFSKAQERGSTPRSVRDELLRMAQERGYQAPAVTPAPAQDGGPQ